MFWHMLTKTRPALSKIHEFSWIFRNFIFSKFSSKTFIKWKYTTLLDHLVKKFGISAIFAIPFSWMSVKRHSFAQLLHNKAGKVRAEMCFNIRCKQNIMYHKFWSTLIYRSGTYIHFVAQETSIIIKLFMFFSSKSAIKVQSSKIYKLDYHDSLIITTNYNKNVIFRFRPFLIKKLKMNNFLKILVSWATKWI